MSQEKMSRRDALKFGMMGAGAAMVAASNAMAAALQRKMLNLMKSTMLSLLVQVSQVLQQLQKRLNVAIKCLS